MDPYEIWQQAMAEIENQQQLDAIAEITGDEMAEENERNEKNNFIRSLAKVRGCTFIIMFGIIGLLTVALITDWITAWEFIAANIVWFGMGVLFLWGTEFVKKEQEEKDE